MDLPYYSDHTACRVATLCAANVSVCVLLQDRTRVRISYHAKPSWPAGRLLQSSASQACPRCRQPLGITDMSDVHRNFDLIEMIDNRRQQHQQQLQEAVLRSAISSEDLQLTDNVTGWG